MNDKDQLKDKEYALSQLQDLPGVGPATAGVLFTTGYGTIDSIAAATISDLSAIGSIGSVTAQKIIAAAQDALGLNFGTATAALEFHQFMPRITTSSEQLDCLLGGAGIACGVITEFYGPFDSGKTEVAHQLCVTAQLPSELGGLVTEEFPIIKIIYIDTEGVFQRDRIAKIASRWPVLKPDDVLANITVERVASFNEQAKFIRTLQNLLKSGLYGVCIVDSLLSRRRSEIKSLRLGERQQLLFDQLRLLERMAEKAKTAIIITNDVGSAGVRSSYGGQIVADHCAVRLYFRKIRNEKHRVRVFDCPILPESITEFRITDLGIEDSL
ncbi:MAG: helix-hairpin-helix domain-containing protein [Candidatus Heimdallarchaeota archaeon]